MEQDINLPPLGPAGGMAGNPFETLQAGLAPDVYQAMEAVLTSFDQCFQALEHTVVSSQSIQSAIQNGFASTNFRIHVPTTAALAPSAPSIQPPHLSAPRMTLQPFSGRQNENVQAWISLAEEALTASQVLKDLWTYVVVQSLREAAATWYIARKRENNDQTLPWDDMKKAMLEQWDNPTRINELHMRLDTLPCKGTQIPLKDMSPGDRIYKFITHLPPELYMTLIPQTDQQDISYFYSAAQIWEGLQKIPQKLAAASCPGPSKFLRKFQPPPPSTQSATTMPYLSSASTSSISDPMDLDAMSVGRDPRKPPSTIRCYNCNLFGNLARDCHKAPCRATPVPAPQECFRRVKSMHLLKEEGEREDEDVDGVYDPEEFDPGEENAEEYDPHKPDLELQYLVNKANLMEQKKELTKEEERAEEEDLFQIMHAYCDYCEGCSDWSTCLPGANEWKPGSPDHDDDDWRPQSPDEAYLKALCCWASSTTPPPGLGEERPEEMHYIAHSNLPPQVFVSL
ncbi:hypothetical protein V8E53_002627 [Lactarius tabidus]